MDRSLFESTLGLIELHQPASLVHADKTAVIGLRDSDWRPFFSIFDNCAPVKILERIICSSEAAVFLEVQLDDIGCVFIGIIRQPKILARFRIV